MQMGGIDLRRQEELLHPNVMSGLSHHEAGQLPRHCYPTRSNKLMACDINVFFLHKLESIHDVAIAAIEGEVIPGPICNRANLVATAEKVEQVQEQPSKPGKWASHL